MTDVQISRLADVNKLIRLTNLRYVAESYTQGYQPTAAKAPSKGRRVYIYIVGFTEY